MPSALVPLAEGFEEIEAVTIVDVLRRGGVDVVTAGLESTNITGSHQIALTADRVLDRVDPADFDLIVLPGGPGTYKLNDDPRIAAILKQHAKVGKITAAICAAPLVLSNAGLLEGKKATSFPSVQSQLLVGEYMTVPVVVDDRIVTSRGPGTAMAFALKLVELLMGKAVAAKLAEEMLFQA